MRKIFVVQCHPQNILNIELFPNYGITTVTPVDSGTCDSKSVSSLIKQICYI